MKDYEKEVKKYYPNAWLEKFINDGDSVSYFFYTNKTTYCLDHNNNTKKATWKMAYKELIKPLQETTLLREDIEKHLRFFIGIPLIFIMNVHSKFTSKWVYIWITIPQLWYMIYRDMDRIEAANHIKNNYRK